MSQTVQKNIATTTSNVKTDIELRQVVKVFNGEAAVRGIDLKVRRGEFFSILGPSGCGKTTTLRLIAGFEQPTAGDILIRGQSMLAIPPYRRPVNTVFQSYALFNHLTVRENIAFGLKLQKKLRRTEIQDRVRDALRLVQMEEYASRYPAQLSGGQQQRVALARALVNRPAVVLLDEPLGALDLKLRKEMQVELSNLYRELGLTFVMVTHDQEEALSLSDRIAVMHAGQIEQVGTPAQIYDQPQSHFVADFIGNTNLFAGRIEGTHPTMSWVRSYTDLTLVIRSRPDLPMPKSGDVVVSVRPEKIRLSSAPTSAPELNCFAGQLQNVMYLGTHLNCFVKLQSGDRLIVRQPQGTPIPSMGTTVYACWDAEAALVLPSAPPGGAVPCPPAAP
jgi:spermidine/putrescine transport system ATP-binding protein